MKTVMDVSQQDPQFRRKNMIKELILCSTIILLGLSNPSGALAITTEDIISGLGQREQSIKTIFGKFILSDQIMMNDGNMVEFEKQYVWAKNGSIQKITEEYKTIPERFKQKEPYKNCTSCPNTMNVRMMTEKEFKSFDGQFTKRLFPDSNQGGVYSGSQSFSSGKMPADWLLLRMKEKPLSAFLKQDRMPKYVGDVNLEGRTCHLLEFTNSNTNGKLYLKNEQGELVPVKYDDYIIDRSLPHNIRIEYIFSGFRKYDNITLPTTVIESIYNVYPGREELITQEIFTVEQLEVNTQIPESDLSIQFPAGTRVNDTVENKKYIVP
jgi:hypothetical protein